jgi:hypothetical protein
MQLTPHQAKIRNTSIERVHGGVFQNQLILDFHSPQSCTRGASRVPLLMTSSKKGLEIGRPCSIKSVHYDSNDPQYPINVQLIHVHSTNYSTIEAKYLLGADGAKNVVRKLLGIELIKRRPTEQT